MRRTGLAIFTAALAGSALAVTATSGGCRSATPVTNYGAGGAGGDTTGPGHAVGSTSAPATQSAAATASGGSSSTSGAATTSGTLATASAAGGGTSAGTGAGGGASKCTGLAATIADITGGAIGPGVAVTITGVVAMSQKFLVSHSKSSGSCLWGVYVSAPGITVTAPGTGILVLSYGTGATVSGDAGKSYCPELGVEPVGDEIPDATKPGDVLTITGKSDYFLLSNCTPTQDGGTMVSQFQIANVCSAVKTGTAAVPTPAKLSAADVASLAGQTDKAFYDRWGGVKVDLGAVTAVAAAAPDAGSASGGPVDNFGTITLDDGLQIPDTIYYQGYDKKDVCHAGAMFSSLAFTSIIGFPSIDFCTWSLYVDDKCTDFTPASSDCAASTTCP